MTDTNLKITFSRTNILQLNDLNQIAGARAEKKKQSLLEEAVDGFRTKNLPARAKELIDKKTQTDNAKLAIDAAINALQAVEQLLITLRDLTQSAGRTNQDERADITKKFALLGGKIGQTANNANFKGLNLLTNTANQIIVQFGNNTNNILRVGGLNLLQPLPKPENLERALFDTAIFSQNGQDFRFLFSKILQSDIDKESAVGFAGFSQIGANNSNVQLVDAVISRLEIAVERVRNNGAQLGGQGDIISLRLRYTQNFVQGGGNINPVDLNEDSANEVARNTRKDLAKHHFTIDDNHKKAILQLIRAQ